MSRVEVDEINYTSRENERISTNDDLSLLYVHITLSLRE